MITLDQVSDGVAAFLSEKWGRPVTVSTIEKIFGGASRETYKLELDDGTGVVVRRDPPSSLIDTERELEYGAYERIFKTGIPVPEPLFLENDPSYLEQPFSVMSTIGGSTDVNALDPDRRHRLGIAKYEILGNLAALDPLELGFDAITQLPAPGECASGQLEYWVGVIDDDEIHPQPVARAAIRWLRANLPPAAQKIAVVHGDYRSGNFMFDAEANITGVLDWEMCHLGDPLEDLAWSLDPLWSGDEPALAGRLIPHDEAIDTWCRASGLECDPVALKWWRIFVSLKALAIWISSSEDFESGEGKDAILATAGWVMTDRQNRILIEYLAP